MLQRLYKSDRLTDFVRRVQKKTSLYRCADEFQALNVVALEPGSWHAWHYDTTECTITLLLQAAESGGEFTATSCLQFGNTFPERFRGNFDNIPIAVGVASLSVLVTHSLASLS